MFPGSRRRPVALLSLVLVACAGLGLAVAPACTGSNSGGSENGGGGSGGGVDAGPLNSAGLSDLAAGRFMEARENFRRAAAGTGSPAVMDTARFFFALTNVAALILDVSSDGNSATLERVGDVLDRLGCTPEGRVPHSWGAICPDRLGRFLPEPVDSRPVPETAPRVPELLAFLKDVVLPVIDGAVASLEQVSPAFGATWTMPFADVSVQSDYGDALVARA